MANYRAFPLLSHSFVLLIVCSYLNAVVLSGPVNVSTSSINSKLSTPEDRTDCISNADWSTPSFDDDCVSALESFYYSDVSRYRDKQFEFMTPDAPRKKAYLDPVITPRRYVIGKCTLAIVMLSSFQPRQVPGSIGPYQPSDIGTYKQIWRSVENIAKICLPSRNHNAGWEAVGSAGSIGVFVWATGSNIDRSVSGGTPVATFASNWLNSTNVDTGSVAAAR